MFSLFKFRDHIVSEAWNGANLVLNQKVYFVILIMNLLEYDASV